jgi:thioesterase domain-containing protein
MMSIPGSSEMHEDLTTIERRAITSNVSPRSKVALVALNDKLCDGQPTIYCVHDLSGTVAANFIPLARALAGKVHLVGIQTPRYLLKQPDFPNSVDELAGYYVTEVMEGQPEGSIILAGWSLGVVIALAMADQLKAQGREIRLLISLDGSPEGHSVGLRKRPGFYVNLALNAARCIMKKNLRGVVLGIGRKASKATEAPDTQHPASRILINFDRNMPHVQSFVRRLYDVVHNYKYVGQCSVPVVVYEASVQPFLYLHQVGEIWRSIAPKAEIVRVIGAHKTMIEVPYVDALAGHILSLLNRDAGDKASNIRQLRLSALRWWLSLSNARRVGTSSG